MSRLPSLAARNVRRNRRRSGVTLAAILLGVALVVVLRGFVVGTHELMIQDVVQGRTGALQIHRAGYAEDIEASPTRLSMPYDEEMLARLRSVRGVAGVAGRIQFGGLVSNGVSQTMFVGRGVDPVRELEACPRSAALVKEGGQPLSEGDSAAALVGYELGQSFGLGLMDSVSVQTSSPEGRANAMDLQVKGLTVSSLPFENKRVVAMPLQTAQQLLELEGKVTEYAVGVSSLSELERIASELRQLLGSGYEVHTWKELQPFVRDVIVRQQVVLGGIGVVLFVIVLTGIVNTMLMSVFERVREIGTMLAVGVRRRQVLWMFLLEAMVLGALGGVLGALIGRGFLFAVALKGIPLELAGTSGKVLLRPWVSPQFTLMAVVAAVLASAVASAYPAWRASRLNPVDALRAN
ncbi:MAG: ABC transporter permease [Myxococcales bacterium]|nr:ABC transporter permease [Myxococcales bacterium]